MQTKKSISTVNKVDLELYIATEIMNLGSLHYGYWLENEALTLENLRTAQERYSENLLSYIPSDVKTVLDVGSGIGDNAKLLVEKGYSVVAISPDSNHAKYYKDTDIEFINTSFEDFSLDKKFDLILMSESQNYFDHSIGFEQCIKHLKPAGYLLIAGKFRKGLSSEFSEIPSTDYDYIKLASNYKFNLLKETDITSNIIQTISFARQQLDKNFPKFLNLVDLYFKENNSLKAKVAKFALFLISKLFANKIKSLKRFYSQHINPELFEKFLCYKIMLFKLAS